MSMQITKDNFEAEVMNSEIPVLVDFWAPWCGPCKMIGPVLEELSAEFEGKVKIGKINVDDEQELAVKYSVMSIPTLVVFNKGNEAERIVGFKPKAALTEVLNKY